MIHTTRFWSIWGLTIVFFLVATRTSAQIPLPTDERGRPTLAPLLEDVTPAVVNISVTAQTNRQRNPLLDDPFFRRFFNVPPQQGRVVPRQSVGSGVVVDAREGYVITNHHVVARADQITVTLQDKRQFQAELVGSDEGTDIALLKIDADDLVALPLGDSDALRVGDFVVAIGNPFGLGQTVTSGIVSALGRSGLNIEGYEDFIQTDASINPGNSGGALVDLDGRLVGINTAIIAPSGGNVGIGFAVPVNMAQSVTDQLLEYGEVRRGRLGIGIQDLTPNLAEALDVDSTIGAIVTQVEPDSAAEKAGIKPGDIVTAIDGRPVDDSAALRNSIGLIPVGEKVEISLLRDGKRLELDAEITSGSTAAIAGGQSLPKLAGARFEEIDRDHPRFGEIEGAMVSEVEQGSPAWRNGLRRGDIILAVNRRRVRSLDQLSNALEQVGATVALNLLRGNTRLFLVIQ